MPPVMQNVRLTKSEIFPPVPDGIQDPMVRQYLNELYVKLKELEMKNHYDHADIYVDLVSLIP